MKYPIWGYYSGIRASILDQPTGFQFSVAAIMVQDYSEKKSCWPFYTNFIMKTVDGFEKRQFWLQGPTQSLEEAHLWELHWWDFRARVLGD